jgi:hypothetical protein
VVVIAFVHRHENYPEKRLERFWPDFNVSWQNILMRSTRKLCIVQPIRTAPASAVVNRNHSEGINMNTPMAIIGAGLGGLTLAHGASQADRSRRAVLPRRALIFLVILAVARVARGGAGDALAAQEIAQTAPAATATGAAPATTLVKRGYVEVGALNMYYEIDGKGKPSYSSMADSGTFPLGARP